MYEMRRKPDPTLLPNQAPTTNQSRFTKFGIHVFLSKTQPANTFFPLQGRSAAQYTLSCRSNQRPFAHVYRFGHSPFTHNFSHVSIKLRFLKCSMRTGMLFFFGSRFVKERQSSWLTLAFTPIGTGGTDSYAPMEAPQYVYNNRLLHFSFVTFARCMSGILA